MQAGSGIKGLHHVVRFGSDVAWDEPGAWVDVGFLAGALAVGLLGASATRATRPGAALAPPAPAFQP